MQTNDGRLAIQRIDIAFQDGEFAYVSSGLAADDRVVTTSLATVRDGIALRLKSESGAVDIATTGD